MKLVRYGNLGREKPGLMDDAGVLRDLSGVIGDITPDVLSPAGLDELRALDQGALDMVPGTPRLGCPVNGIGKIVCIGLNFADHAAEQGRPLPTEPQIFIKANSAISGPMDPIRNPKDAACLDWEVELAFVMGRDAHYVAEADALDYVAGYCIMDDVSERHFQKQCGGGTTKGKSADTFAPIGPWLVTADEIPEPENLAMWTDVNGHRRQDSSTAQLVFGVKALVAYLTRFMSLRAGDLVSTGTPPGVGMAMKPEPQFLTPGDEIELGIEGLGQQRHDVIAWDAP